MPALATPNEKQILNSVLDPYHGVGPNWRSGDFYGPGGTNIRKMIEKINPLGFENTNKIWTKKSIQQMTLNATAAARTYHTIQNAPCKWFSGVRIWFANSEATPPIVNSACIAVTNTNADKITPSTGVWVPVTFNGAISQQLPAALVDFPGATNTPNNINWTPSDWIPLASIPQIDSSVSPYVMFRAEMSSNFTFETLFADSTNNVNTTLMYKESFRGVAGASTDQGLLTAGNAVTTNANIAPIIEFISDPCMRIAGNGDSITEGKHASITPGGGTVNQAGWLVQAQRYFFDAGIPINIFQVALGSQTTGTYTGFANTTLAKLQPHFLITSGYSPNNKSVPAGNTLTSGVIAQEKADILALCNAMLDLNIIPWISFLAPDATLDAAGNTLRKNYIADLTNNTPFRVFDLTAVLTTESAGVASFIDGLFDDTLHPNRAGYDALGQEFVRQIQLIFGL